MKKIIYTFALLLATILSSNAQIESLAGPRVGGVFVMSGISADMINTKFDIDMDQDDIGETGSAFVSLYGWQWESRFADGGDVTGIVEWVALVGGMEKGLFLPSVSSLVGVRTASGVEFAVGPNLSLSGIGMVFGAGFNFKSGNLNIPVNIAFVPGMIRTETIDAEYEHNEGFIDPDGIPNSGDEYYDYYETLISPEREIEFTTGSRISITLGFNLSR